MKTEKQLWEALALGTVGIGLGVVVEEWDTAGRQNAPDGRFERGKRIGFVEVTSHADTGARGGRAAYNERTTWWVDHVVGTYGVWIDPTVPLSEHDQFVPELIRLIERNPGSHLLDVVDTIEADSPELFEWAIELVENHRLEIHPRETSSPSGTVFTTAALSRGGAVRSDPDAVLAGVGLMMESTSVQKRIAKLARTGDTEQHLFVRVDNDVWGWEAWQQLLDDGADTPTSAPRVPGHLDGVWLWSSMNRASLRWLRSSGWAWQPVELPPGMSWR